MCPKNSNNELVFLIEMIIIKGSQIAVLLVNKNDFDRSRAALHLFHVLVIFAVAWLKSKFNTRHGRYLGIYLYLSGRFLVTALCAFYICGHMIYARTHLKVIHSSTLRALNIISNSHLIPNITLDLNRSCYGQSLADIQ